MHLTLDYLSIFFEFLHSINFLNFFLKNLSFSSLSFTASLQSISPHFFLSFFILTTNSLIQLRVVPNWSCRAPLKAKLSTAIVHHHHHKTLTQPLKSSHLKTHLLTKSTLKTNLRRLVEREGDQKRVRLKDGGKKS